MLAGRLLVWMGHVVFLILSQNFLVITLPCLWELPHHGYCWKRHLNFSLGSSKFELDLLYLFFPKRHFAIWLLHLWFTFFFFFFWLKHARAVTGLHFSCSVKIFEKYVTRGIIYSTITLNISGTEHCVEQFIFLKRRVVMCHDYPSQLC